MERNGAAEVVEDRGPASVVVVARRRMGLGELSGVEQGGTQR
jgi:hypothetical protein